MFCLDEADKMMERAFKNDVTFVFNKLPPAKQVMALSATYTSELASILTGGVTNSIFFRWLRAGGFLGRFFVNSGAKKTQKISLKLSTSEARTNFCYIFLGFYYSKYEKN